MRLPSRIVFIASIFACVCGAMATSEEALPTKSYPARATAAQFLATYRAICLDRFPSQKGMQSQAEVLQFTRIEYSDEGFDLDPKSAEYNIYYSEALDLFAEFGEATLSVSLMGGGGDEYDLRVCRLRGQVLDPQNLTVQAVHTAYQSYTKFTRYQDDIHVLRGTLTDALRGHASFRLPRLYTVSSNSAVIGSELCGDLPKCRVWRGAWFEVGHRLDEVAD